MATTLPHPYALHELREDERGWLHLDRVFTAGELIAIEQRVIACRRSKSHKKATRVA